MKKQPRKTKQWAEEAYSSLHKAMQYFTEEHPSPSADEKLSFISYAPLFAATNRGIKDKKEIEKANDYVIANLQYDIQQKKEDEAIDITINYLLAYLDAQVAFGKINENKSDQIMEYITDNYEIPDLD